MKRSLLKGFPSFKEKKSDHLIIFIHGLSNKPPKEVLKEWYIKSIWEGLKIAELKVDSFDLEVVYWADLLYPKPLDPKIKDEKHELYLDEPYVPFHTDEDFRSPQQRSKKSILDRIEAKLEKFFLKNHRWINLDAIFDFITSRIVNDLHVYYRKKFKGEGEIEEYARVIIRQRLVKKIRRNQEKKIMLISHSMGSIIAYDVLQHTLPNVPIDTFITIDSPLGLPMIKREIFKELRLDFDPDTKLPTPENITRHWYNFSDINDAISADHYLEDDYRPNSKGIGPRDIEVINTYKVNGVSNVHKSFGYLRAPEMIAAIYEFVTEQEAGFFDGLIDKCKQYIGDVLDKIGGE